MAHLYFQHTAHSPYASRVLTHDYGLKHLSILADPVFQREQLASLSPELFAHISGAWTAALIRQLHLGDRQLEVQ
jgi:hypothetical protein